MVPEGENTDFTERRKHPRKPTLWKAQIRVGLDHFPCRIFDMSLSGVGVRTDAHLLLRTKIKLVIDHIGVFRGKVAWVKDDRMGIEFTIDESEVRFLLGSRGRRIGLE
ncbi:MAG: PilZ domain-containing protein [Proteobacteria bacterium]|nr:PilZ domain-containing protein [Pseudomonadota bacterium]